jgi:hypothetical protein
MESQKRTQTSELIEYAALLADLKRKWPDLYRHLIGVIKAAIAK